jgi:hypothetical protein
LTAVTAVFVCFPGEGKEPFSYQTRFAQKKHPDRHCYPLAGLLMA